MKKITCNQKNEKHRFSFTKLANLKKKLASINQRNWYLQPGMLAGSFLEAVGQYFKKFEYKNPLLTM